MRAYAEVRLGGLAGPARRQDLLKFRAADGSVVAISGNDVIEVIDGSGGIAAMQAIQSGRRELRVRLQAADASRDAEVWARARERLEAFFAVEGLAGVAVERDPTPPQADPRGGKFHAVWSEVSDEREIEPSVRARSGAEDGWGARTRT